MTTTDTTPIVPSFGSPDTDRKLAVASRLRLLDILANDKVPLIGYHFPWSGLSHVARKGDGFRYCPYARSALSEFPR